MKVKLLKKFRSRFKIAPSFAWDGKCKYITYDLLDTQIKRIVAESINVSFHMPYGIYAKKKLVQFGIKQILGDKKYYEYENKHLDRKNDARLRNIYEMSLKNLEKIK